jgi:hypothetical protein
LKKPAGVSGISRSPAGTESFLDFRFIIAHLTIGRLASTDYTGQLVTSSADNDQQPAFAAQANCSFAMLGTPATWIIGSYRKRVAE